MDISNLIPSSMGVTIISYLLIGTGVIVPNMILALTDEKLLRRWLIKLLKPLAVD